MVDGWKYYNHAYVPTTAPHEEVDVLAVKNGSIWKQREEGKAFLARWTENFDCGYETKWWYVICDKPFDIRTLPSKKRYVVKKGLKNFDIRKISPKDYINELYLIEVDGLSQYPEKYRPKVSLEGFIQFVNSLEDDTIWLGAFSKENNEIRGFIIASVNKGSVYFSAQKVFHEDEKKEINAALVYGLLDLFHDELLRGTLYICDGSRNINHETNFQDYLEKYFGFRKAYCNLKIEYNPLIKPCVKIALLLKNVLLKLDNIGIIHMINGVIKMEEYTS